MLDELECTRVAACEDGDSDGLPDYIESALVDSDGDGNADQDDEDSDDDGVPDALEGRERPWPDADDDGIPSHLDGDELGPNGGDSDRDGKSDSAECPQGLPCPDSDGDHVPDYADRDAAPDAGVDMGATLPDADLDGIPDQRECASDPGFEALFETPRMRVGNCSDTDRDGVPDHLDDDSDGDGLSDARECPDQSACPDRNENGIPDQLDTAEIRVSGGACSLGEDRVDLGWISLVGLLTLSSYRRRRKAELASTGHRLQCQTSRAHGGSLLVLSLLLPASLTRAQAFELNRLRPAPLVSDGFALSGTKTPGRGGMQLGLTADYAYQPLIVQLATGDEYAVVEHQLALHVGLAVGLGSRFMLFGGAPVNVVMNGNDPPSGIITRLPRPDGAGVGDGYIGARVRLLGDARSRAVLAAQAELSLPLASLHSGQLYSGDDMVQGRGLLLLDVELGHLTLRANLGVRIRQDEPLLNALVGDELSYGMGAQYAFDERFRVIADLHGGTTFKHFGRDVDSPLELLAGGKYQHETGFFAALAAGPGLVQGVGAPHLRSLLTLGFSRLQRTSHAQRAAAPALEQQVITTRLPRQEPARRERSVSALAEIERSAPSGEAGQQSTPRAEAVVDQQEHGHGQADADADQIEASLACPHEPGAAPADGCPAEPVEALEDSVQLLGRVYFARSEDRALPGSIATLRAVQKALADNASITLERVEAHTDLQGSEVANLSLSKRRGRAVKRWLREQGVDVDRLQMEACGEARPLSTAGAADRARDRRVELQAGGTSQRNCERF